MQRAVGASKPLPLPLPGVLLIVVLGLLGLSCAVASATGTMAGSAPYTAVHAEGGGQPAAAAESASI